MKNRHFTQLTPILANKRRKLVRTPDFNSCFCQTRLVCPSQLSIANRRNKAKTKMLPTTLTWAPDSRCPERENPSGFQPQAKTPQLPQSRAQRLLASLKTCAISTRTNAARASIPRHQKLNLRPEAVVASHLDQDEESFRRLAWEPTAERIRL